MDNLEALINEKNGRDEWYTPENPVRLIENYLSKDQVVWCPFDKEDSYYVKILRQDGYKVIYSHILDRKDFLLWEPKEHFDVIVSNPPFSKIDNILRRLFFFKKPFAMFVPIGAIFDTKVRFNLLKEHGVQLLIPEKRTIFLSPNTFKSIQPPFKAVYICWNLLPQDICFEDKDPLDELFMEE